MKIHHLSVCEAFASLNSRTDGLDHMEAKRRLAEYGRNEVDEVGREPWILAFSREFTHFFAIILWIAAGLAFFAGWREPGQGMDTLGWAILGVIAINGAFSYWQAHRAERALAALKKLLPRVTKVARSGSFVEVPAAELVPGDVILLEAGDSVPADCRLVEAYGVRVNNATITGESLPAFRDAAPCDEAEPMRSRNILLAGTSLVSGEARALVYATGAHSAFGQIARLTQETGDTVSPLQREISRVSRIVAAISMTLGVVFFFIGQGLGLPFWGNFIFAIGIIVANVPEGLLPTVTLSLAMASQRMAKRKALVRHLPAVEALGCTTVICTDKTGTLTRNRMSAKRVFVSGRMHDATPENIATLSENHRSFFEVAARCHDLKKSGDGWLGDPMEVALVQLTAMTSVDLTASERIHEIPFDSEKRRLSVIHASADGPVLFCKGAPEAVIPRCDRVVWNGEATDLAAATAATFIKAAEEMGKSGLRVLAFSWRQLAADFDAANADKQMILAGLVGLEDPPRAEVADALKRCRDAGIKVIMVTGDHPQTAEAIARETGLFRTEEAVVITGPQMDHLSNIQLQLALDAPEILFARVRADQKTRIVSALRKKREIVAVTGDGVNDAPALRKADVGIAMGITGTDVARESADMVLLDDNFASIVAAIEEGRAVFSNIRNFLTYILTSNVPEIIPYLAFVILRIPLPLTIIQILAVDLGTDMLPALGLGAEKPGAEIMKLPPRPRSERLLSGALLARAYLFLGMMQAIAAMCAYAFVLHQGGWKFGQALAALDPLYLQSTTACLSAIIVMQIANVFLCRDNRLSLFSHGITGNRLVLAGVAAEVAIILLIVYTPWGNAVFNTAPIEPRVWLFILPFGIAMIAIEETRKWICRGFNWRFGLGCRTKRASNPMKVISAEQVHAALSYPALIDALGEAYGGEFKMPPRQVFLLDDDETNHDAFAVLPSWGGEFIGVKAFTYFPTAKAPYKSLYSQILLFNRAHGEPLALVDGTTVTFWRTAGISGLATRLLSRENSETMLVLGTGNLASYIIRANASVRPLKKIMVWGRSREKAGAVCAAAKAQLPHIEFSAIEDRQAACAESDIIVAATGSHEPVVLGDWVKPGTHTDFIGNHHAIKRECDTALVTKSRVYVDSYVNAMKEAGEILVPISEGVFKKEDIVAELAEMCGGKATLRQSDDEITLFKSIGMALSDLVGAGLVYKKTGQ